MYHCFLKQIHVLVCAFEPRFFFFFFLSVCLFVCLSVVVAALFWFCFSVCVCVCVCVCVSKYFPLIITCTYLKHFVCIIMCE